MRGDDITSLPNEVISSTWTFRPRRVGHGPVTTLLCDTPFQGAALQPVLNFFDGLSKGEPRLRWDRLVALHLVLLAFVNSFGYDWQYSDRKKFEEVASKFNYRTVLVNLVHWLGRHHLDKDDQVKQIIKLVK